MNPRNCLMLVGMLAACGGVVDDAKDKVDEGANNTKEMINDTAVCKGLIRDSVSARIESVITDQIGGDSPIALSDLTQIAKAYALTLDSTSLLAGNVIAIAAATESSQCDQTLDCNDPVLSESVGTLTKTCDSDVETYAFEEGCQLYATPISGAVSIDGPLWTFDQFQVVDDRYLDGGVFLENVSADRFAVDSIDADSPVSIDWLLHTNTPQQLGKNSFRYSGERAGFYGQVLWSEAGAPTLQQEPDFAGVDPTEIEGLPVSSQLSVCYPESRRHRIATLLVPYSLDEPKRVFHFLDDQGYDCDLYFTDADDHSFKVTVQKLAKA